MWRFTAEWERDASVLLRLGDPAAIDAYAVHDRVESGTSEQMLADALSAWKRDVADGRDALLIASDNSQVRTLNEHAQQWLRDAGRLGEASVEISERMRAHIGDRIVSRNNNRTLRDSDGDWVRNGQEWVIVRIRRNGEAVVENADRARVTLPVDYLRDHVQLAYATTAHRSQGRTVDTAHVLVDESTSREIFYVGMTRGKHSNGAYVTAGLADSDATRQVERGWRDVLESVLRSTGAETSATATITREHERVSSIRQLAAEYETLAAHVSHERYGPLLADTLGDQLHDQLLQHGGYDALVALVSRVDEQGLPVRDVVRDAVRSRQLHDATDAAAVVHQRLTDRLAVAAASRPDRHSEHIAGLIPSITTDNADMRRALEERAAAIVTRAETVLDRALTDREPWAERLGDASGEGWRSAAIAIAAYRDKWGVTAADPLGPIDDLNHQRRADYTVAKGALDRIEQTSPDSPRSPRRGLVCAPSQVPTELHEHRGPRLRSAP